MAELSTDFSNFYLHDFNAATIAGGLLPEMAEVFGVEFDPREAAASLHTLSGAIGESSLLQDNISQVQQVLGTEADGINIAANWMDRSGTQKALDRSLWTPELETPQNVGAIILTGATANGQDRTAALLHKRAVRARTLGMSLPRVYMAVGNRLMKSDVELANPNVAQIHADIGMPPKEYEYAQEIVAPALTEAGYDVIVEPYEIDKGTAIAKQFISDHPAIFGGTLAFVRVANGGIQLAGQFRRAVHGRGWSFDLQDAPQVFVLTDEFPVARNEAELLDARHFQNPFSGIKQIVQTARNLALMSQ